VKYVRPLVLSYKKEFNFTFTFSVVGYITHGGKEYRFDVNSEDMVSIRQIDRTFNHPVYCVYISRISDLDDVLAGRGKKWCTVREMQPRVCPKTHIEVYVLRIMFVDPRSYAVVDGSGRHLVVTDHKWAIHDLDAVVRRNEDILNDTVLFGYLDGQAVASAFLSPSNTLHHLFVQNVSRGIIPGLGKGNVVNAFKQSVTRVFQKCFPKS
jgi:hypothetical protein